jgi:hypothetical protein
MREKFEDRNDIVRDSYSKAILSTNKAAYIAAKKRRDDQNRYIKLEEEVKNIKTNIQEMSKMLKELLSRGIK